MRKNFLALILAIAMIPVLPMGVFGVESQEKIAQLLVEAPETESYSAVVTVNDNNAMFESRPEILGAQAEISHSGSQLLRQGTQDLADDWVTFSEDIYDMPVIRFGGASIEHLNMMNNIGAVSTRKGSVDNRTGEAVSQPVEMGPVEMMKLGKSINPDFQYLANISVTTTTPEDSAHYAAFLTHRADESEWGALRASLGLTEPIKVIAFEIGNEIDYSQSNGWTFDESVLKWYQELAPQHISAIREVCPDAKIMICGKTAPWNKLDGLQAWTEGVIEAMGADIDYLSFHPYYDGMSIAYMDICFDIMEEAIEKYMGPDHNIKLFMTEHACFGEGAAGMSGDSMLRFFAALSVAQFFNRLQARETVGGATFHSLINGNDSRLWPLTCRWDGVYFQSAIGRMFHVYGHGMGDRVIESSVLCEEKPELTDVTDSKCRLTVAANAEGDHTLKLILVNGLENTGFDLSFDFQNEYKLVEERVFTAPNLDSYPYSKESENIISDITTAKNEAGFNSYHMPNKSVVVLTLETNAKLPQVGEEAGGAVEEVVTEVETGFTDIDESWAKAEIGQMTDKDFVTGYSATEFAPEQEITRAEFTAIITRMIGLEGEYPKYFSDVGADDWYCDAVNGAFFAGVLKGKQERVFEPNEPVTIEEVAATANRVYALYAKNIQTADIKTVKSQIEKCTVSEWAVQDVTEAAAQGFLYRLYENGNLNTAKPATRAETVSILYRLYNALK